jgi:cation transport ATPase
LIGRDPSSGYLLAAGRLVVEDVRLAPGAAVATAGLTPDALLARAAALEAGTRHPLAAAILAEAARRGLVVPEPDVPGVSASGSSMSQASVNSAMTPWGNELLVNV